MEKIIGQIIKQVQESRKISVQDLAKEIGTTRNNVYNIFERSSIDTDLLKKIGRVLEYDFFEHFLLPETIEKIKLSEATKKSKFLIEIELDEEEFKKNGLEEKILKIIKKIRENIFTDF